MKIALFISGRLTCYDENLIPLLEILSLDNSVKIYLFCSINNIRDDYHITAESKLKPWLADIRYEIYSIPNNFIKNTHEETLNQIIDGENVPYTNLSCFYNDFQSYKLIEKYSKENNILFDICCKIRPDIQFQSINSGIFKNRNTNILYSCIPPYQVYFFGDLRGPMCISDAFAFGSMEVMKHYCNTYNFIIDTNYRLNGYYRINYEPCVTESFINNVFQINKHNLYEEINNAYNNALFKIEYITCPYELNSKRRVRDNFNEVSLHRK